MVNAFSPSPILFVDHAQHLGGAEHSLLLLARHLDPTMWQSHVASPEGALAKAAQQFGIPHHSVALPRLKRSLKVGANWLKSARTLATIAENIGATVLVANTVRAAFYAAVAAKLCKRPFLWHMRDFWLSESKPRYPRLDYSLKKLLCNRAACVVANSHATAAQLPCANVTVVHNGIDFARFATAGDDIAFREAHNIPQNAPLVGIVGRLRPWKGQHRFVEMAASVLVPHPNTHFVIVGGSLFESDNGYTNVIRQTVQQQSLSEKVHFTGHLDDVRHALEAMDIFVHSGDPEPFGLVNAEAMAAGLPVVAFAHGALPEIVQDGKTGLLVPPFQVPALAQAVNSLLTAPARATELGYAGQNRVQKLFSIQQTAENFSSVLQTLLGAAWMKRYVLDARTATAHFPGIGRYVSQLAHAILCHCCTKMSSSCYFTTRKIMVGPCQMQKKMCCWCQRPFPPSHSPNNGKFRSSCANLKRICTIAHTI